MNRTFWINFGYIFMVPALPFLALVNGRALCSPDSPLLDIPVLGFFLAEPWAFAVVYAFLAFGLATLLTKRRTRT
ncbi:hypothetical protein Exig_0462 [Exiguobacterium sibiricum 255-15]|uniref:Uncharacterized protein n=1 Tax=Exiguobacterium sibiricum (strain DSM 17290 / CCUG 55495 / CIP 109462 / JCM 13490 / 255-15) TaxID=262543 RepID=B1YJ14_EXIS2|nr:hypothetical protein [Exiguobacterium sibiricum]ACB59944.1 hypothetical protein Exig_0462 [Exiguobacterium sibiricum 255-15]